MNLYSEHLPPSGSPTHAPVKVLLGAFQNLLTSMLGEGWLLPVDLFLIIAPGILWRFLRVFVYLALVPSNAIAVVTTRLTASETLTMRELVGS